MALLADLFKIALFFAVTGVVVLVGYFAINVILYFLPVLLAVGSVFFIVSVIINTFKNYK